MPDGLPVDEPPDDDARAVAGPLLRGAVGTRRRRTWLRRLLGPPALLVRWIGTRGSVEHHSSRAARPSTDPPVLTRFPEAQLPSSGVGPGVHRTYVVTVPGAADQTSAALARLAEEPNLYCTIELGSFESDDDEQAIRLDLGRDLLVELAGPFDGPVRVVERRDDLVRLQTRSGHLEAGQITFATMADGEDLVFVIRSWTRSRDRLVDALYRAGPARWLQQHMWISVCRQVAKACSATRPVVTVTTEWVPDDVRLLGELGPDAGA